MRYISVCSGIEAATVAWHPLGWQAVAYSEIDRFPSAVLAHHYPDTPNLGDMMKFKDWPDATVDLLVGGTPCQSFSVAGFRKGLDDPRGNLMLTYLAIAGRYRPAWLVWENVPGVLSSNGGRDFGAFLWGLGQLGYGWAYRSLDAQYFNLAQRRSRVFVVASDRGWASAAAVLFERASLQGHPAPRREERERTPDAIGARTALSVGVQDAAAGHLIARCISAGEGNRQDYETTTLVAHSLRADGFDASEDGTGRGVPLTLAIRGRGDSHDLEWRQDGTANAILTPNGGRGGIGVGAVAFAENRRAELRLEGGDGQTTGALKHGGGKPGQSFPAIAFGWQNSARQGASASAFPTLDKSKVPGVGHGMQVRRLTPRECERLQGFPDNYTLIPYRGKPAADGPRYKALGNSMAVPVMRWIGRRIAEVDALLARSAKRERAVA